MPWSTKKEQYSRRSYHSSYGEYEYYDTFAQVYELTDEPSKFSYLEVNIDHTAFDIKVRFANKEDAEKFEASLSKNIQFYRDGEFIVMHYRSEPYQKGLFLKALLKLEPRLKEKAEEIFNQLKLIELNDLRKKPTDVAIDFVIKNQAKNYSLAEWLLLDYFDDKNISSDTILKLVNRISPENPGFKTANDIGLRLAALKAPNPLMEQKTEQPVVSLDTEITDEAEQIKSLELKLAYALNGSDQGLTDLIFSQLCNDSWDKTPLEGVSGNHKFLVNIARQTREERAAAKLAQNPVNSSRVTSSVSSSTSVTSPSALISSSAVNQPSATPPVTIRMPRLNVSSLVGLFTRPKPTSDKSEAKSSPQLD